MSSLDIPAQSMPVRRKERRRWIAIAGVLLLCATLSLTLMTNVRTNLTAEDIAVMERDLDLKMLPRPRTYEEEIRVIRSVQAHVFDKAPFGAPIPEYEPREPSNLMKYGRGLCYDRRRTLD